MAHDSGKENGSSISAISVPILSEYLLLNDILQLYDIVQLEVEVEQGMI